MKKNIRKVLSLVLVLVMLCSMMSISAFATDGPPSVTVYITKNMFTAGGFDTTTNQPVLQTYIGGTPPTSNYFYANDTTGFSKQVIPISTIASAVNTTKGYYGNPALTAIPQSPNVLDAIVVALTNYSKTPYGGWDTYSSPNGGYISGFSPDGGTSYGGSSVYYVLNEDDEIIATYDVYTGTGWQIACTQSGTIQACSTYGSNYGLFDGMVIVFDLSSYSIYYPRA